MSKDFDLFEELEKDSKIDQTNLDDELSKIPYIHGKWLKQYIKVNADLRRAEKEYARLKLAKTEYYSGTAPDAVYKQTPLNRKVLKSEVPDYLRADGELQDLEEKVDVLKDVAMVVEKFISSLNNRGYNLGKAVDYVRWKNGG